MPFGFDPLSSGCQTGAGGHPACRNPRRTAPAIAGSADAVESDHLNYLLGAAGVRFWRFLAALPALIPNLTIETYFGFAGTHAVRLAGTEARLAELRDLALFGGLLACIGLITVISIKARRALALAVAEADHPTG